MRLDFRIDWGCHFLYSRRQYHPFYRWDGRLECANGRILETRQLEYPVIWWGPGHCPREKKLDAPEWKNSTRRGLSGVRVAAEVDDGAEFHLTTASGDFRFTAEQIIRDGRLVFPVWPKYSLCHVIVTRSGHLWFRPPPAEGQRVWEAEDLAAPVRDWARMRAAWLEPGQSVEFAAETGGGEAILHIQAMAAPGYDPGSERQAHDYFDMELHCDGHPVSAFSHYFREHDDQMQMLEDVWTRFAVKPGAHRFRLKNGHAKYHLLLSRLTLQMSRRRHRQLSLPPWALAGEPLIGRIYAERPETVEIRWPDGQTRLELNAGWNDFRFSLSRPGVDAPVTAGGSEAVVPAVYALSDESPEVMVGFDMTTIPHDGRGLMDWLLDYTWRTRLGNLAVFRSFLRDGPGDGAYRPVDVALLARWGGFCRDHRIHVEAATDFLDGTLAAAAGEMMHSAGLHEYPGAVYARDPAEPWASADMKTASERYVEYLKIEIDKAREACGRTAFGDASGGHRYGYLAGVDFIRSETMVPHTQHLCSQARPAAEALGKGEWGVHIAIQHAAQPYFETHLGMYFLSLYQPWMMGASMIYEEDSLFHLFKEERQSWDDRLTQGKRDMTRDFYRFAKTHPRRGKPERRIAFLEGRYAAPFNGIICGPEQDPHYPVWGLFGRNDPAWGHAQPEKCRQLLDVLMPGASTLPLRQRYDRRRFFFSGTPYGDFDETPAEAGAGYFGQYALLLNLGWHTMIREDYDKLLNYASGGGALFTGVPQFSAHVKRDFLRDWRDLALWNGGDLGELCGVKVRGPGMEYSGQWNAAGRERFPEPELSAMPSDSPDEDGPCRLADIDLAGAEVVAWDASTNKPLVTRRRIGRGCVYLLTAWAYPGHERLQAAAAAWIAKLAGESRGGHFVEDASREVFWNVWPESGCHSRMMLLNTDWTVRGNAKRVRVVTPAVEFEVDVVEREPLILTSLPFAAIKPSAGVHVEVLAADGDAARLRLHGVGVQSMTAHYRGGRNETRALDFRGNTAVDMTLQY